MITRIEVDGFKSLRDFSVDLEPFTVFIGPNSAGKSNILEALGLLSRLVRMPIVEAFKGGRGRTIDQFTRTGTTNVKSMRFAVEFLEYGTYPSANELQSRFRYELTIERRESKRGVEQLIVQNEQICAIHREGDTWIDTHTEFANRAGYARAGTDYSAVSKRSQSGFVTFGRIPTLMNDDTRLPAFTLREFRLLHVDAMHLGQPSERTDAGELAPNASNLPTVLAEMPDSTLGAVRANLVASIPGIASFDVVPDKDDFRIEFELSGGQRMPARLVSDGTLRILALLAALLMEPRAPILGIEEPENGVYPGRLRGLVDMLRRVTNECPQLDLQARLEDAQDEGVSTITPNQLPTQILVTTHSPIVLSALLSEPRHLRFIDMVRRNGERVTRARTVGPVTAPGDGRFVITPQEIAAMIRDIFSQRSSGHPSLPGASLS